MKSRVFVPFILLAGAAACGGPQEEDILTAEKIEASRSAPELPDVELSEDPTPPPAARAPEPDDFSNQLNELGRNETTEGDVAVEEAGAIPASFHGRWAMSVEDCADPRRAGSGALAIGGTSIELPDGEGRLFRTIEVEPGQFVGIFNYDGDRGRWSATEELSISGNVMVRRVEGGGLRYRRCTRTGG